MRILDFYLTLAMIRISIPGINPDFLIWCARKWIHALVKSQTSLCIAHSNWSLRSLPKNICYLRALSEDPEQTMRIHRHNLKLYWSHTFIWASPGEHCVFWHMRTAKVLNRTAFAQSDEGLHCPLKIIGYYIMYQ